MAMKKGMGIGLAVAALLIWLARRGEAAPPPPPPVGANLYGKVTDAETGQPVRDVRVAVYDLIAHTDANGNYELLELAPGGYTVHFEKEGYQAAISNINLVQGNNELNVQLRPLLPGGAAEFYMPSGVKHTRGEYQQWLGTKIHFSCEITNKGTAEGTHKLNYAGYHNGALHDGRPYTITLAPGETYTWKHQQWLMSGSYKVTLSGDWEKDNYAEGKAYA